MRLDAARGGNLEGVGARAWENILMWCRVYTSRIGKHALRKIVCASEPSICKMLGSNKDNLDFFSEEGGIVHEKEFADAVCSVVIAALCPLLPPLKKLTSMSSSADDAVQELAL
jgi:hypothetical protein